MTKAFKNKLLAIVVGFVVLFGATAWLKTRYVIPIMMYHNIDFSDEQQANTVGPASFAKHMRFLKEGGYNVISPDELINGIVSGEKFERKTVVITFDDGYQDNYENAFHILKQHDFPAIVFVSSDLVGQPGYLTWAQLKEMHKHDFTTGSHTRTHAYLPDLEKEQLVDEIFQSKAKIEEKLGQPVDFFAYPIGGFSDEIQAWVREAGYKAAFATNRGYDRFNTGLYELNRIRFNDDDTALDLWAKLSGFYNLFRSSKHPY